MKVESTMPYPCDTHCPITQLGDHARSQLHKFQSLVTMPEVVMNAGS